MSLKFNGERLKKARIYRGLTVAELAAQVGCQRQTLSMYEIARSQPTDQSVVAQLSKALNFPIKYFYEWPQSTVSGTVYFRSLLTTNKKYRSEQIVKMDYISQIYDLLQDYVEFPKFIPLTLSDDATPEEAASALRQFWNLGNRPIENIVSVVEEHGILATTFSTTTDDVDAFSRPVGVGDKQTFIIAYSSNKTSAARIHFDVAHELGHICLHEWSEDIEDLDKIEFKKREQQANDFASAFLLPEETFGRDAAAGPQTITYYKQLKKKWRVSIAAMIRRSANLNIMSQEDYQNLIRIMQRRGIRKAEPLDDIMLTAEPAMLKTSVMLLLQEEVFTPEEFMKELSDEYNLTIDAEEIEYLLNLSEGTLSKPKMVEYQPLQLKNH